VTVTIYGIKNCDTMKRARAWLEENHVAHRFHDYRAEGIDAARLTHWAERVPWEKLLNRAGTTFRKLPDADKAEVDQSRAIGLMLREPAMIKRPVIEYPGGLLVGFDPAAYAATLL
jgi:arsenate reductase